MNPTGNTVRRLAVIDPIGNVGGASRFAASLLPALARIRPNLHVAFFGKAASMHRDGLDESLPRAGVEVVPLKWVAMPWSSRPRRARWGYSLRKAIGRAPGDVVYVANRRLKRELQRIGTHFDLVYFPWPYRIPIPNLPCPSVCTVHDLNFKYFFGSPIFSPAASRSLDRQLDAWLSTSTVVTSSEFMADEIARFYPGRAAANVIRLAPFADDRQRRPGPAIPGTPFDEGPYILCANNVTVHKNVGAVIAAHAILRRAHKDLKLVVVGAGTEEATGTASSIGTIRGDEGGDVIGLGYVSSEAIDQLIANAVAVVNASLYEGGNGPGLDAWMLGTPVAMSDIPPFREHIEALGVEAALFDPRSPADIAAKVADILDRPGLWAERVERSKRAISDHTWDKVAAAYLQVFDAAYGAAVA